MVNEYTVGPKLETLSRRDLRAQASFDLKQVSSSIPEDINERHSSLSAQERIISNISLLQKASEIPSVAEFLKRGHRLYINDSISSMVLGDRYFLDNLGISQEISDGIDAFSNVIGFDKMLRDVSKGHLGLYSGIEAIGKPRPKKLLEKLSKNIKPSLLSSVKDKSLVLGY